MLDTQLKYVRGEAERRHYFAFLSLLACGLFAGRQETTGFRHLVGRAIQIRSRNSSVKAPSIGHIRGALDRVQMHSSGGALTKAVQM